MSAPVIFFGLQQIIFANDYPRLDAYAQAAVEGHQRPVFSLGIARNPNVIWSTDRRYWGLPR